METTSPWLFMDSDQHLRILPIHFVHINLEHCIYQLTKDSRNLIVPATLLSRLDSRQPVVSRNTRPDMLTRACLLVAAALPWYAVVSGTFGLYFYVLLLVPQVGRLFEGTAGNAVSEALFFAALMAALPLALLLLATPIGLVFAAIRHPPGGLAGRTVRGGCVISMSFAALYAAIIIVAWVNGLIQGDAAGFWLWGLINVAVLLCGMAATWRGWTWLLYNRRDRTELRL